MKNIIVTIELDGKVTIDAIGFKGTDCAKATAFLEKALGTVSKKVKKPEFAMTEHGKQSQ